MLTTVAILLAAAAIAVPLSRRAGFGSVLGYLVAGIAIGPAGLRLITDVEQISEVSELGVVMLLFLIGLEVRPARLWVMRKAVFGLGSAQVVLSAAAIAALAHAAGLSWPAGIVLGAGLAMSSTAIVLPMLGERELLRTRAGRDGFAVLLFQDLAFIPLVALVPVLAGGGLAGGGLAEAGPGDGALPAIPWASIGIGLGTVAAILVGGRFLLPPVFRIIGGARTPELFTIMALLAVAGTAFLASAAGLSASLGAFLAGVLLSESEYRHELQADIEPFEGILLGFFFISVGMSAELGLLLRQPVTILLAVAAVLLAKIVVAFVIARIAGQDRTNAVRFALALPQGSEFSFVLFAAAVAAGALAGSTAQLATLVIALSMVATPLLFAASERFLIPRLSRKAAPVYDTIPPSDAPVIVAGFGRIGQIVGRILHMQRIPFVAIEGDPEQLEVVRGYGNQVYYGDATRPDLLRAAGAETAKVLVIALDSEEAVLKLAEVARRTFPHLAIVSRARNRRHVYMLMDRGITDPVRDTFHSSLKISEQVLDALDVPPETATRAIAMFAEHDERALREAHAFYHDEQQLIQSNHQAAEELAAIFEADRIQQEQEQAQAKAAE